MERIAQQLYYNRLVEKTNTEDYRALLGGVGNRGRHYCIGEPGGRHHRTNADRIGHTGSTEDSRIKAS
jgi:hypothetical protein